MWVCACYEHCHMTDSWVNWRCAPYWAGRKLRSSPSENEQYFCWEWRDVDIIAEPPHRYSHLHSPRPQHELCVSLSQLPPPNAVVWASQPTKDVFIALTWKIIFSLLYRSLKGPEPDKENSNKSEILTANSTPKKIVCTSIDMHMLAVVVFHGWSMGLSFCPEIV